MDANSSNSASQYASRFSTKLDMQLAEVLRKGDQQERNMALSTLRDRYQNKLTRFISKKLPSDWVDDVCQETWIYFDRYVRVNKITKGVPQLLWTIAKGKRADAVRRLTTERNIEMDLPQSDEDGAVESEDTPLDELFTDTKQFQLMRQIPFATSLFSDCERVIWVLNAHLHYDPAVIARLMGKKRGNVYQVLLNARKKMIAYLVRNQMVEYHGKKKPIEYLQNDDLLPDLLGQEFEVNGVKLRGGKQVVRVERFSNHLKTHLTPLELRCAGIPPEDFRSKYVSSFILTGANEFPFWAPDRLYLVLTRRSEMTELNLLMKEAYLMKSRGEFKLPYPHQLITSMPMEFMFAVEPGGDEVYLNPLDCAACLPDFTEPGSTADRVIEEEWRREGLMRPKIYMVQHAPRLTVRLIEFRTGPIDPRWWSKGYESLFDIEMELLFNNPNGKKNLAEWIRGRSNRVTKAFMPPRSRSDILHLEPSSDWTVRDYWHHRLQFTAKYAEIARELIERGLLQQKDIE